VGDEHPTDKPSRGGGRTFYDWVIGTPPPSDSTPSPFGTPPPREDIPDRIGRYAIERKIGQGGMGRVFAARDEQLGRTVAIKLLSSLPDDDVARRRFWREARAAASVSHPNICQLYEIGEENGELFIAMELLEGEALAERLQRGPLAVADALPIGLGMLAALSALHARAIVHRDLKPSNVFLTAHGVKLLDFGLARPSDPDLSPTLAAMGAVTMAGAIVGTPGYMAPEQVNGEPVDVRADVFSVGAILFEMLAGRPAFAGRGLVEALHATLHEQPPALAGGPAVAAVDRVIRKALAKRPTARTPSAEAMADELRAAGGNVSTGSVALARPLTRLVALPFRVLRPDPETDFLAFGLPDAISLSLSSTASLVVRSSASAARFGGESLDLKAIASEADVDMVVTGTLLRSGDQLRVTTQLVEAPAGTLITSHVVQSSLGDLFQLQDDIAKRVVEALSLPLVGRESTTPRDTPRSARAYEFYLRANELSRDFGDLPLARDLYRQCLEEDPQFAPAWARLGRCLRVMGKYKGEASSNYAQSEAALRRALAINPDLSVAHKFFAHLEADTGHPQEAMVRLLGQASRKGNDPELFAGLVHACRYCGLYEQSMAAHEEARRLDPNVETSLEQTLLLAGEVDRLLKTAPMDHAMRLIALGLAGRRDEAREVLTEFVKMVANREQAWPSWIAWTSWLEAWVEARYEDMRAQATALEAFDLLADPEGEFLQGWLQCEASDYDAGLVQLRRAVSEGFYAAPTLERDHHFDPLRRRPEFQVLLADTQKRRQHALEAFRAAGGERLLGL
jgi:eukaryotic-like serine/threonine-protein kinase